MTTKTTKIAVPESCRVLRGGATADFVGPRVAKRGYDTVANGYADEIRAEAGEIAIRTYSGNEYTFARYVVGPPADIRAYLVARYPAKAASYAARVDALVMPGEGPAARLANALNIGEEAVAKAADTAGVSIQ